MKNVLVALWVCVFALPSFAAVKYEFRELQHSDDANVEFGGHGVIDGARSRVDFTSGNAYRIGSYIISSGTSQMTIVDPTRKLYSDVNTAGVAAALGAMNITVANKKVSSEKLDDHPKIAGYPTDHYRLTMTYDITLMNGAIPITQTVETVTDKWTTSAFGDVAAALTGAGVRTGNKDLDDLLQAELQKIKGFPLREMSVISTTARNVNPNSELKINPTRKTTREMTITSVSEVEAHASLFNVPADYRKADSVHDDGQEPHTVTLQPAGN